MIAKGNPHGHGAKLARYLITGRHGERAELVELRNLAGDDIHTAFAAVELQAAATRCRKPFFHAYVRLPSGEGLGREQWRHVADRIERQLDFAGHGRAIVFHHHPAGDTHMHIAWSRIDLEHGHARDPGLYKNKLKEISRQLECELGLARVSSAPPAGRKTRAPGRKEFEQARRLGTDLPEIREAIRASWDLSHDGRGFMALLATHGLVLARGDRRDFVVVDRAGGEHALSKRITGATAAETRTRLADLDRAKLPRVDQVPERGIAEYPAAAINAPAATATRPIVAPAPKPAPETETGEVAASSSSEMANYPVIPSRPPTTEPVAMPAIIAAEPVATAAPKPVETRERPIRLSLFRRAAGELVRRVRGLQPKPRRRRSDDTRGAFGIAAKITRRAVEIPAAAHAVAFLADTLDWLNLWHNDAGGSLDDGCQHSEPNHLSPHL